MLAAAALGLITAGQLAGKPIFYGSYPITPASEILHELSAKKRYDVRVFQAEDEFSDISRGHVCPKCRTTFEEIVG